MATANIIKSPTDEVLESANQEYSVTDKRGRVIKLKKPNIKCHITLAKALGENAKNEVLTAMLLPCFYVTSIDGDPVLSLNTESELTALYCRLDEEGIVAIAQEIANRWGNKQNVEEEKATIKK